LIYREDIIKNVAYALGYFEQFERYNYIKNVAYDLGYFEQFE
jgi:hypothetical protein